LVADSSHLSIYEEFTIKTINSLLTCYNVISSLLKISVNSKNPPNPMTFQAVDQISADRGGSETTGRVYSAAARNEAS
jgi:hypothetical protein